VNKQIIITMNPSNSRGSGRGNGRYIPPRRDRSSTNPPGSGGRTQPRHNAPTAQSFSSSSSSLNDTSNDVGTVDEKIQSTLITLTKEMQVKTKLLTDKVKSEEEKNISLQQSLQSAEQSIHDGNIATEGVKNALVKTLTDTTKKLDNTVVALKSEREQSTQFQSEVVTLTRKVEELELKSGIQSDAEVSANEAPEEKEKRLAAFKIADAVTFDELEKGYEHNKMGSR